MSVDPNPNNYVNDAQVETAWAALATRHAEIYEKLVLSANGALTLTKYLLLHPPLPPLPFPNYQ